MGQLNDKLLQLEEGKSLKVPISDRLEYDIVRVPGGYVYHPYYLKQENTFNSETLETHTFIVRTALNPFYVPN
jgi:hypothetical protein